MAPPRLCHGARTRRVCADFIQVALERLRDLLLGRLETAMVGVGRCRIRQVEVADPFRAMLPRMPTNTRVSGELPVAGLLEEEPPAAASPWRAVSILRLANV